MSSPDTDPDDRTALENLEVVANYVRRTTHWEEGRPDRHDAIQALKPLYDQIDWIERGIVEWRDIALQASKNATVARATARVAINHLQVILNGRLDANQMFAAEKAARELSQPQEKTMLNKKPDTKHPRIWIELERTPNHEFNERQAALATHMLERLADPKDLPLNAGFRWSRHEALYCYGGPMGYRVLNDDGEWFNLEYFGRE